jgi:hypothetical protein
MALTNQGTITLLQLLARLRPIVRKRMLEQYVPNCCVATCRVLRHVLRHYTYVSRPAPVFMYVYNAAMASLLQAGLAFPEDPAERSAFLAAHQAWGIGITKESPGEFAGHLVLLAPLDDELVLIDGSIAQASRPQYKIELPEMLVTFVPPSFARGGKVSLRSPEGVVVTYERFLDSSWQWSPDWRLADRHNDAIRLILSDLEKSLDKAANAGH